MKGSVIGFDAGGNIGAISGEDGQRYDFAALDWRGGSRPWHGDRVEFVAAGSRATQIILILPEYVTPSFAQFYLSPSGRIGRSQYWLKFFVPVLIIAILLDLFARFGGGFLRLLPVLFQLVMLWPGIAILIKRIHDRNKPGSLVWALYVPTILAIAFTAATGIAIRSHDNNAVTGFGLTTGWLSLACVAIGIWFFIEFGCLRGTVGPNSYGPDPVQGR